MLFWLVVVVTLLVFFAGPRPKAALKWRPELGRYQQLMGVDQPSSKALLALREQVLADEALYHNITPGAEKNIVFSSESRPKKTRYCVVYMHGFSACRQEISPVPERIAEQLHANYHAYRLTGHGMTGEDMAKATSYDWQFDAIEAIQIAQQLGEEVIVISTSTGGTLMAWLAQQPAVATKLAGLIMVAPNFGPQHWSMPLFLLPWSRYFMPWLAGKTYGWEPSNELGERYWTYRYPISIIHDMAALVREVRRSPVEHIDAPTLFIYSDHDKVVNARKTDAVARRWGSAVKHRIAVPAKPNDNNHVITGEAVRPETTDDMVDEILLFIKRHVVKK